MFADPTGRRLRTLRIAGITATVVLAVCLGAVAVAMSGGPSAPFTQWAVPHQAAGTAGHSTRHGAGQASTTASPAQGGGTRAAATTPAGGPSATPSASAGATAAPSPSPSASASPTATNRAGRTPPGRTQTKSANPHASASAA